MSSPLRQAAFSLAAHKLSDLPADCGVEVAFAGRSNAGKSSAVNAICDQRKLARTSRTPGRTQQIVIFNIDDPMFRLADLPGYGYAKVPPNLRDHWRQTLDDYFRRRESLRGLILVMDIRHPLKPFDEQMLNWCRLSLVPCHVLMTKADKLGRGATASAVLKVERAIKPMGFTAQAFSALKRDGVEQARQVIIDWLGLQQ